MRQLVNNLLGRLGYRLVRLPVNRFQAMGDTLRELSSAGYCPQVIVDAGANRGDWTRAAREHFPGAQYHLIEAQPACRVPLEALAREISARVHLVAVSEPGVRTVHMMNADGNTGAWVARPDLAGSTELPATTLDELVSPGPADRALLKLDLENHELIALRGATQLLQNVEVIVSEVSFYRPAGDEDGLLFGELAAFLRERNFEVYDFAALGAPLANRRLRTGDVVFVHKRSPLGQQRYW